MSLSIIQAGSFTTVQDGGRFMQAHWGVPVSGFMDKVSAQLANKMVGNQPCQGLLEITWTGLELISNVACTVAVAGAEFNCLVNDRPVNTDQVIHLNQGDCFKMGHLEQGVRAYLAVAGGLDVPLIAGSQSTLSVAGMGGYRGRALRAGDELPLRKPAVVNGISKPNWKKIQTPDILVVRAKPGPEVNRFDTATIRQAFGQVYHLSQDCNRQGFRLIADSLTHPTDFSMKSSGLLPGSLQVTPDGQTILAMADAQTTGGYPRILVINQDELHKLVQARPKQQIYFFVEV